MAEEKSTTTLNKARVDELLGYIKQTFYSQAEHAQGIKDFNAWWLSVLGQPNGVPKTDANNKILQGFFPDYILGQLLWGGTIAGNDKISPSSHLSSKIDIVDESISSSNVAKYTGIYFIATADANTSGSIVNSLDVRTGDWVISTGVEWVKIDNTDAVRSVADYVGSITAEELRNRLVGQYKDGNTYKNYALGTMHYADGSGKASQLATTEFARSILGGIASQSVFSGLYADKAKTLLTPRKLWGNDFDGSNGVYGDLFLHNNTDNTNENSGKLWFNSVHHNIKSITGLYIQGVNVNSYGRKKLSIFQHNNEDYTSEPVEVFAIHPNGNVMIGRTSDTGYKLDVNGTFNAQGATTLQSTLNVVGVATHNDHILLVNSKSIVGQLQDDKTNISLLGISNTDTVLVGYGAVGKYNTNIYGKTVNIVTKEGVTSAQFDENKNLKVFGYISGMQGVAAKGIADFGEGGVGSGSGGTRYTLQKAEDTNKVTLQLIAEDGSGTSTQDINTFNATRAGLVPNASSTSHILFGDGWKQLEASHIPNLDWAKITTGKPTTISGYGITDAYTKSQIQNGVFPNMRVGLADDLGDIEETLDEEYTFQPTANPNEIRDGYAQIESLKGNSLVWNQLVGADTTSVTLVAGHIYISNIGGIVTRQAPTSDTEIVVDATADKIHDLTQMFGEGNEPTTIEEFERRCPKGMPMDYNEGEIVHFNGDIKSVGFNQWDEEWESKWINSSGVPVDAPQVASKNFIRVLEKTSYYISTSAYTNFEVHFYDLSYNHIFGITVENSFTTPNNCRFIKFNTTSMYGSTYNHDICINISDPDKKGTYEPYTEFRRDLPTELFEGGMKSAGTAYDEVYWDEAKGKYIKVTRIGEVDLGTLNWAYEATYSRFKASIPNHKYQPNTLEYPNIICSKYLTAKASTFDNQNFDKSISSDNKAVYIYIRDSAYTDTFTFKAAMSGVMLYYELAEPIVEEIDIPYMDYQVSNSGTEEIVSEVPTTPIKARVIYNFDTIGTVKQNRFDVSILKSSISNLSKGIGVSGNWVLDGLKIGTYDVLHKGNTSLVIDSGDNFGFTLKVADSQIQMSDITEDELRQMINTAWGTNYEA